MTHSHVDIDYSEMAIEHLICHVAIKKLNVTHSHVDIEYSEMTIEHLICHVCSQ